MIELAELQADEALLGCRLGTRTADARAFRLCTAAVLAECASRGVHVARRSSPNAPHNATEHLHARGRYPSVQGVDGSWYVFTTGYVQGPGLLRLYWRAAGRRTLEVQTCLSDMQEMAAWSVRLLRADPGWDAPPVPVSSELERHGSGCRYVWTLRTTARYDAWPRRAGADQKPAGSGKS